MSDVVFKKKRLTRKEASIYFRERWDIQLKPSTLAKKHSEGTGPKLHKAGKSVLYPVDELDAFATQYLGELIENSSQEK
ncbi:hypothetical protein ACFFJ7_05430 [Pseudochelatococcus lubricantis]|uniref:hypothetical protein n=1 Tax=Pseudochelatococcus lubricantis TaxID=1538102 RepID=UPI0035EC077C